MANLALSKNNSRATNSSLSKKYSPSRLITDGQSAFRGDKMAKGNITQKARRKTSNGSMPRFSKIMKITLSPPPDYDITSKHFQLNFRFKVCSETKSKRNYLFA